MFKKKNTYKIDMNAAGDALQNIFAACNQAPNCVPFDKIVLRQEANTRKYNSLIAISAIILVLTFLSPLAVLPASRLISAIFVAEPVELINDYVEFDNLYLQFEGDNILYKDAYIETTDGEIIYPISFDKHKKIIVFPYVDYAESNIYIPVRDGDTIHFLLTPQ